MSGKLFFQAILKFTLGIILIFALLFIPAGLLLYFKGWVFMGILFIPMFIAGIVMMVKNPYLLEKRLNAGEKQFVIKLSGLMFLIGFVAAGLNFRFGWFTLPDWTVIAGTVVFLFAYLMYAEVLRENTYLSRTVEVQENQKVIDTGLYGIVRHPMYSATVILFFSMPIVLGSPVTFVIFLAYPFIIAERIRNEEKVLSEKLEGYAEYQKKVKYRIIPLIW